MPNISMRQRQIYLDDLSYKNTLAQIEVEYLLYEQAFCATTGMATSSGLI